MCVCVSARGLVRENRDWLSQSTKGCFSGTTGYSENFYLFFGVGELIFSGGRNLDQDRRLPGLLFIGCWITFGAY